MDLLLNIPTLCLLLLFAGILLGHMIWGRGRAEDEEKLKRLHRDNENLHCEVEDQRRAYEQLESSLDLHKQDAQRLEQTNQQLEQLQDQHQTLKEALAAAEQNGKRVQTLSEKLQTHVSNFHEERDQFVQAVQIRLEEQSKQIEKLTLERDKLVDDLVVAQGEASGLQSTVDRQSEELEKLRQAHAKSAGHEETVVALRREIEETESSLGKERHQREHLQSVLDGRKIEYETLMQDLEKLEAAFQKMCLQNERLTEESSLLASLRLEHADLQQQSEEQTNQHRAVCQQRDEVLASHREAQQQVVRLQQSVAGLEKGRAADAQEISTLQAKYDDKVKELKQVSAACDELVTINQRVEEELEQTKTVVLVQLQEQLESEQAGRQQFEQEKAEVSTKHAQALSLVSAYETDLDNRNKEVANLTVELADLQNELKSRTATSEIELAEAKEKIAKISADLVAAREEVGQTQGIQESQEAELTEAKEQLASISSDLVATREELSQTRDIQETQEKGLIADLNATQEQLKTAELKRQALETTSASIEEQLSKRTVELRDLSEECDDLVAANEKLETSAAELRTQVAELEQKCTELESSRRDMRGRNEESTSKLQELLTENSRLDACHSEAQEAIAQLEGEIETLRSKQDATETALDAATTRYEEKVTELSQNEIQLVDLQQQLDQASTLKTNLIEQNDRLQKIASERDSALQGTQQVQSRVRELERELESQSREFTSISQKHQQLQAELQVESKRYDAAKLELANQRDRIATLERELQELDSLRAEHRQLQSQLTDVKTRLLRLSTDHDKQVGLNQALHVEIDSLRRHNDASQDTIRDLRRERAAVIDRLRQRQQNPAASAPTTAPLKVVSYREDSAGGKMKRDKSLGMVYTEAPSEVDDLKEIYGIATILEQKLNEFGVYTYRQIMDWDTATIEEFSNRLSFRDRIQRDGWVAQATRLHEEKYGTGQRRAA